jgi:hypothetical protein
MQNSDYSLSNKNISVQFHNCEICVVRLQNILSVMYTEDEDEVLIMYVSHCIDFVPVSNGKAIYGIRETHCRLTM